MRWEVEADSAFAVLLVSAREADYVALAAILKDAPWRLRYAHDSHEAWRALHEGSVGVVMVACESPQPGDWREVLAETREMHERPRLVLLSDLGDDAFRREALELGAFELLQRPLAASQVLALLELAAPLAELRPMAANGSGAAILVVEAPEVAAFIQGLLERHGYQVASCSWRQAPAWLEHSGADLVITNRPDEVAACHPSSRVLYTCAVPDPERLRRVPNRTLAVLQKPFLPDALLWMVRKLLLAPAAAAAEIRYQQRQAGLRLVPPPLERLQARAERSCRRRQQLTVALESAVAVRDAIWARIQSGTGVSLPLT